MNKSTRDFYSRRLIRLVLLTGAILFACAGVTCAQSSIDAAASANENAVTRPRRLAAEQPVKERKPHTERRIFVRSTSLFVGRAVIEDKLIKQPQFNQLGYAITRDEADADLILELRHDVFTMYVFTILDARTDVVLLSGKLSSLGGTVAGKVARRFVKEMPLRTSQFHPRERVDPLSLPSEWAYLLTAWY
jgi:hypothetical protein